jgi:hypothetical protein
METRIAGAISVLLVKWTDGDASALERLMPVIYDELRRERLARLSQVLLR